MSHTDTGTAPSMMQMPPPSLGDTAYVVRLRLRLRAALDEARALKRDNGELRRELNTLRLRLRKRP